MTTHMSWNMELTGLIFYCLNIKILINSVLCEIPLEGINNNFMCEFHSISRAEKL